LLVVVLLLSEPPTRRVKSVEPPKHPNFFVGLGVVLLAVDVMLVVVFGVLLSIVRVLDLDLAEDVLSTVVLSVEKRVAVAVGSLPRDLDLADDDPS
jgi:hypothetical protein